MTQNPPIVFDAQWQEKHEARNKMLLELQLLEDMLAKARTHEARGKLTHQVKDKKRAAHVLRMEMDAIRSAARSLAHERTQAAEREQRKLFGSAFKTACKANLSTALFESLIQEADRMTKGSTPQPVTLLGKFRHLFGKVV